LSWRLPVRLSRCLARFDDQTGSEGGAVVAGVGVVALEAVDAGGLADDLGGGERPAAADRDQRRRERLDERCDLCLERVDLDGELAAALGDFASEPGDRALDTVETGSELVEVAEVVERPGGRLVPGVELVQMPAQPADHAGSLCHEVFAMVDEETQLAVCSVEASDRQVRLPECRASDRQGVDRVGLAEGAGTVAGVGHQLRRHPNDLFAGREQVALQPAREVPAVLDRPQPLRAVLGRSREQPQMIVRGGSGRGLRELPALLVDCDDGMAALVRVDPDCHHSMTPSSLRELRDRSAGISQLGRHHAPLKPRRPVPHRRAGRTTDTSHEGNKRCGASPHDGLTMTLGFFSNQLESCNGVRPPTDEPETLPT